GVADRREPWLLMLSGLSAWKQIVEGPSFLLIVEFSAGISQDFLRVIGARRQKDRRGVLRRPVRGNVRSEESGHQGQTVGIAPGVSGRYGQTAVSARPLNQRSEVRQQ